jgi:hypothetical protein
MTDQLDELLNIKYESLILLKERGYIIPSEEASIIEQKIKIRDFKNKYIIFDRQLRRNLFFALQITFKLF